MGTALTAFYRDAAGVWQFWTESPGQPVSLPVNVTLGRPEHHEFRWLRYPEARKLLPERLLPVLDWAHALVEPG